MLKPTEPLFLDGDDGEDKNMSIIWLLYNIVSIT